MSKIDKLNNIQFTIKTGDGKIFTPLYIPTETSLEFNTNVFDFIDVPKSLVERKQPKSQKIPLKFYFQGDNVVEQTESFLESSKDKRYWIVTHPYYGEKKGHPISITVNDENLHSNEINIDFMESLIYEYPKSNLSIRDNSLFKRDSVLEKSNIAFTERFKATPEDVDKLNKSNNLTAKSFEKIQDEQTSVEYKNTLSSANKSTKLLFKNPNIPIINAQLLLNKPSEYKNAVIPRINAYLTAFNYLLKPFKTKNDILFFESQGANIISNLCYTSTNYNFGSDYTTIKEIDFVINSINKAYNLYMLSLDNSTTSVYQVNNYSPYASLQSELNNLITYTISNLYELVFDAQKERIIYLEKNSNIILIAHKYLGLASEENIETLRKLNNIYLNELFLLKKGRKITYYV